MLSAAPVSWAAGPGLPVQPHTSEAHRSSANTSAEVAPASRCQREPESARRRVPGTLCSTSGSGGTAGPLQTYAAPDPGLHPSLRRGAVTTAPFPSGDHGGRLSRHVPPTARLTDGLYSRGINGSEPTCDLRSRVPSLTTGSDQPPQRGSPLGCYHMCPFLGRTASLRTLRAGALSAPHGFQIPTHARST